MDISKIKERLTQLQTTTSTKDNFWKPQPGKTQIRIVPYKFNKENPFVEAFFHYGLGGNSYDRTEVTVGAARLNDANQPTSWRFDASNGDFEKGCVTMYGLAK